MTETFESSLPRRLFQLLVLAIAAASATFTRSAMGPLQEAVKTSLSLSDNQMALLQGLALAIPIAAGSIPLGLLADRYSRLRILLASMVLALVSFVLTAIASDFGILLFARCLLGLTIPGILVCTYSMAGDLFPANQRGRATMLVAIGETCGAPAAFALGGMLLVAVGHTPALKFVHLTLRDWSWALLWMGVALVPVTLLMLMLREPPRTERVIENPPLREVWPELWRYRAVAVPLQLARATLFIADGAVFVWGAPLYARKFHLPPDRVGAILAGVLLFSSLLGPLLGGNLVDFCQRRGGPRRTMLVLGGFALLCVPIGLYALPTNVTSVTAMLFVFLTLGGAIGSAALALTVIVIPGEVRGLNIGISLVVGSLFFIGLAPLVVSVLSGLLGGEGKIDEALAIVCAAASLMNAAVFILSARFFPSSDEPFLKAPLVELPEPG